MLPEVKACGVFVLRSSPIAEFLLMKHHKRWDFPKGHVEAGETEIECALRELEEETGIPRDAIQIDPNFRYTTQYVVRDKQLGGREALKTLVMFLGRLQRDVPINTTEHPDYRWFPWNPPHQIQRISIDPFLDELAKFLSQNS